METENRPDETLRRTLRTWRVETPLPPGFVPEVWRRVDRAQRSAAPGWMAAFGSWLDRALPRPTLAWVYVVLLLGLGVSAGWIHARVQSDRLQNRLGQRYVQMIDPFLH